MTATTVTKVAQKRLQQIINSDPFLQGEEVNLDLTSYPSLHQPLADESFEDDRFSPLSGSGGVASRELRAFLEQQTNRPQGPSQVNLGKNIIGTIAHDGQQYTCAYEFNGTRYVSKGKTRDDAAMAGARFILNWKPEVRELDEKELQLVAWIAQSGNAVAAAEKYIVLAIPAASALGERVLTDPKYAATVDAAVLYAWTRSRNDYTLSDREFPRFLKRYARNKRLTLALCDAAFASMKQAQSERLTTPPDPELDAPDFEAMDDEQVESAYRGVAHQLAKSYRR
jgi:hypothetical protein